MPGTVVGLYCAMVERFDLLVSTHEMAARKSRAVFNQRAETLSTGLGVLNLGSEDGWQREPEIHAARPMG
jgi:hypothetical protein